MSLLDFDDTYVPPYQSKKKTGRYFNESILMQEARDAELNNLDRTEVTEDFSDSPFSDRV
jgi:hypothetical protein